jgi:electron transport complex protein RnfB
MKDVYKKLAAHLDTLPQRFPTNTDSGIELRVLRDIFKPEEAEMAVSLQPMPEPASEIAKRIGKDAAETEALLYDMSKKGLIMRLGKPENYLYMAAPFLVGIIEFQLNRFTDELVKDMEEFYPILFDNTWMKGKTRELRTIPIGESVSSDSEVLPYENAEAIIRANKRISVAECMCKKMAGIKGKKCDRPTEVCFQFGGGAFYFVENGLSRFISQEEALEILKKGVDAGLVIQVGASQNPGGMCMCCDCCCGVLQQYKRYDKPSELTNSNYYARVVEDNCTACETCVERCQMGAVTVDDVSRINPDLCIGCGLCAVTCEFDAIEVYKKDEDKQFIPEKDFMSTMMKIYQERRGE